MTAEEAIALTSAEFDGDVVTAFVISGIFAASVSAAA